MSGYTAGYFTGSTAATSVERGHRRQYVYKIMGSTEMMRPEGPKRKARMAKRVEFFGRGCSSPHQLGSCAVSSPTSVRNKVPATWRFRTLYRLTKPLLVSILLILNLFEIFVGVRPTEDLKINILGVRSPDPYGIGAYEGGSRCGERYPEVRWRPDAADSRRALLARRA